MTALFSAWKNDSRTYEVVKTDRHELRHGQAHLTIEPDSGQLWLREVKTGQMRGVGTLEAGSYDVIRAGKEVSRGRHEDDDTWHGGQVMRVEVREGEEHTLSQIGDRIFWR